jgi:hypothetical protein
LSALDGEDRHFDEFQMREKNQFDPNGACGWNVDQSRGHIERATIRIQGDREREAQ